MTKLLLSIHVLAAILTVGPVAVAASMFPPALRRARAEGGVGPATEGGGLTAEGLAAGSGDARSTLLVLHRVCRVYAVVGVAVPVFGFATGLHMGVLGDAWLIASIVLTLLAAVVLGALVLPRQELAVADPGAAAAERLAPRLAMFTGVFNLLWAAVTVLMIVRPGSTTGA
ncbi:hypothetical protein ABT160_22650 [Streptomyces sp. NPDC001941]|uniref:hypothetical protein n=1 Tax=Streptomyces sp. NPDC001941 TaxID=3154659 RepID=UPI00332FAFB6